MELTQDFIEPKNPLPERVLKRGDKKVTRIGLFYAIDFQYFTHFIDLFVDLDARNQANFTRSNAGKSVLTKVKIL